MDSLPDRVPDGIEPMVGYRMWAYTLGGRRAQLHSLRSSLNPLNPLNPLGKSDWDGAASAWVFALCEMYGHVVPDEDCSCGFYAMTRLSELLMYASLYRMVPGVGPGIESGVVLGRVELAGKIIEHEHGYRAERARIAKLIPISGTEQTVMRIAARLWLPMGHAVAPPPMLPPVRGPSPLGPSSPQRRVGDWVRPAPRRHVMDWVSTAALCLLGLRLLLMIVRGDGVG